MTAVRKLYIEYFSNEDNAYSDKIHKKAISLYAEIERQGLRTTDFGDLVSELIDAAQWHGFEAGYSLAKDGTVPKDSSMDDCKLFLELLRRHPDYMRFILDTVTKQIEKNPDVFGEQLKQIEAMEADRIRRAESKGI